jgi:ornithine--oxo-acid transaminase
MIKRTFSRIASNYASLPVEIVKGRDIFLYDKNGKKYVDMLAGYSAVNQGHCHPSIIAKLIEQSNILTLSSRVVSNNKLYEWSDYITTAFKYDKVLAMNSGAEAVETAIKLARRYGNHILKLHHPHIVCLTGNFHGRTLGTVSLSDYESYKNGFGPFIDNIITVKMNDTNDLENVFSNTPSICAVIYEPIQGEGGVVPMTKEFIESLQKIKQKYNHVLLIADEIQSGLGRTGHMTASSMYGLTPDVLILGKALSGGVLPMSCILANEKIMNVFTPGSHGSTFGGNPLACAISMEAIEVIKNECIPNVIRMNDCMKTLCTLTNSNIKEIRGVGMFYGIQFNKSYPLEELRINLLEKGYITCTSRNNTLRITPPLTIHRSKMYKFISVLTSAI